MKGLIASLSAGFVLTGCAAALAETPALQTSALQSGLADGRETAPGRPGVATKEGSEMTSNSGGVSGLPHARGETFSSLDAYLRHLEKLSYEDTPYYRQVEPGLYRLDKGRQPPWLKDEAETLYTREQLARQFGFEPDGSAPAGDGGDKKGDDGQ